MLGFDLANNGLSCLCCKVVLRSDDVRLGTADKWSIGALMSKLIVESVVDGSS